MSVNRNTTLEQSNDGVLTAVLERERELVARGDESEAVAARKEKVESGGGIGQKVV